LANGLSQSALRNDFKIVVSKTGNRVSAPRYVNALFATIGGRPPTPASQAYWLGLANSGLSRQQLRQMFQSSNGTLPQPTLTWTNPASIVYGTPLSSDQLNATASVPGTFTYSPPAGTVLYAITDQPLSVVFTPADTADYPIVTAWTTINVYAAKPDSITSPSKRLPMTCQASSSHRIAPQFRKPRPPRFFCRSTTNGVAGSPRT
jgi:hypothetical protein